MQNLQRFLPILLFAGIWTLSAQTPSNVQLKEAGPKSSLYLKQKVRQGLSPKEPGPAPFDADQFKQKARQILELARTESAGQPATSVGKSSQTGNPLTIGIIIKKNPSSAILP